VDNVFEYYQDFIENTGYKVEFIMDGAATPGGGRSCLNQKWRPWNSTYIINSDGKFSKSDDQFYSLIIMIINVDNNDNNITSNDNGDYENVDNDKLY
jgi:hypothetical protein